MMIERVRLQRKFTLKNKTEPYQRLAQIAQMMILFELTLIILSSLFSLSLHFRMHQIFTAEFWTTEEVINSNLSLSTCVLLLIPYLVFWLGIPGSAVKDFIATALTIHIIFTFVITLKLSFYFFIFLSFLGVIASILGTYVARLREQAKLINEIQSIENADRKEQRITGQEIESSQLHLPDI